MHMKLIERIKNGDKHSFKELYKAYSDSTLKIAISITKNKEVAMEAVQETFIRVFRNIQQYDESRDFEPWLFQILTNECHRIMKKESKIKLLYKEDLEQEKIPVIQNEEQSEDLQEIIDMLDEMYRIPIILKYLKGFTESEIAETLDLNVNTVKTRLLKGRELIKKHYLRIEREVSQYGR